MQPLKIGLTEKERKSWWFTFMFIFRKEDEREFGDR